MSYRKYSAKPEGYIQCHAWAEDQNLKGLVQFQCTRCKTYHFPQEVMKHSKEGCEERQVKE